MKKFDSILVFCAWSYLAITLAALALMYLTGDRWWPGTLMLFGPRWLLVPPLFVLFSLALWRRPKLLIPLLLAATIVVGPFMGLEWSFSEAKVPRGHVVRILTCNVRAGNFDPQALAQLIREKEIDLVALQECPPSVKLDLPPGWHIAQTGVIAIMSRFEIKAAEPHLDRHPPHVWPRHSLLPCTVHTPQGSFLFHSVYLPSPRYGLQNILDRKTGIDPRKADLLTSETENRRNVARNVRDALRMERHPVILAGDFNMPVESTIYRETWSDFANAFSLVGKGYGWTFRDRPYGLPLDVRIDHILTANGATPLTCEIGPDIGSDHLPVIADIAIDVQR